MISPIATLGRHRRVERLRAPHPRPLADLRRDQTDLLESPEVRTQGVRMQRQTGGELADADLPAGQPQVPVQAIAGVVGERLVNLDRRRLGHRSSGSVVDWVSTVSTVFIR
jgi:hypothetical protein